MFINWLTGRFKRQGCKSSTLQKLVEPSTTDTTYIVRWFDHDKMKHVAVRASRKEARLVKKAYKQYKPSIMKITFDHGYILENKAVY